MTELAWAAGLFDGEGSSFWRYKKRPTKRASKGWYMSFTAIASMSQAHDPQVLERLRSAVGGLGVITSYFDKRYGTTYMWRTQRINETEAVLLSLWPFLSHPKREQAGAVLTAIKARRAMPARSDQVWS